MKHLKKHSIKQEIALIFITVMAGTIILCWVINNSFLEKFYIQNKKNAIKDAYYRMNEVLANGDITSEEYDLELRKTCDMYNIGLLVIDAASNTVKSNTRDADKLMRRLYDNFFKPGSDMNYLDVGNNYYLANVMDKSTYTEYLEMWGVLDNGNLFLIRSPIESIRDSVKLSNQFLAYVGFIATVISAALIWFVTTRITRPIMELKNISEQMTKLNFETKYESRGQNEIDLLGRHINELSSTLERTISELKTANIELQRDIEKKEQIDEMRKEFLSNVSHELKTPIALIQGYAEGLVEGINDDDIESRNFYCEVIIDEAGKMNTMVKKLLDLNQLEFGKDVVTMERFDITALIRNFIASAEILISQNEVKVRLEEPEPIYVWADEFKTEEIIRNFFSNAMNHVSGDRIIEIKYQLIEQESANKVRIRVFNTGEPIPEESLAHIWEKFYKVDKARTREYGGSGVGLSIVKAIMESMNQRYGVINYTNGVEFWFELETK
ncbi:MAG: HAMP domain-containing histidine kinase [Lachnospiraceae bacterium]|jgi:signal transduction histidine kinase|nr:two-component sensor histidine kinase [Lachnospiraceae bacterium]